MERGVSFYATGIQPHIREKGKYSVGIKRNVGEELNGRNQNR